MLFLRGKTDVLFRLQSVEVGIPNYMEERSFHVIFLNASKSRVVKIIVVSSFLLIEGFTCVIEFSHLNGY